MYTQEQIFQRYILCKGEEALKTMQLSKVMVLGVGAVGGFCTEILARCGVGEFILVDFDTVDISNVNRQIVATTKTVGQKKTQIMADRLKDINPEVVIHQVQEKIGGERFEQLYQQYRPHIICDCIDSYIQKCEIIKFCTVQSIPIVSSMGAARKQNPALIQSSKLNEIIVCPLAKRIKKTLDIKKEDSYPQARCILSLEKAVDIKVDENGIRQALPSFSVITTCFGVWVAHIAMNRLLHGSFE
uniref:Molybdopterin biosynthesis MoeB protein n=1 Tax=Trepomonas sp. PC1 TaxID=1076344 RepID=A0A146KC88_9EUKA|eukprot:JAP94402.1 Molybdopterin biosynthesis MoeB protein [Trepomonas sp. PC1]